MVRERNTMRERPSFYQTTISIEEGISIHRKGEGFSHLGSNLKRSASVGDNSYFTNFPDDYGEQDMFKIFFKWGPGRDVYIPPKRDKVGRRISSVRFKYVYNVKAPVKKLDTIWIRIYQLRVNLPKFHRRQPHGLDNIEPHVNKTEAFGDKVESLML